MTTQEHIAEVRLKLERADQHIHNLAAEIQRFAESKPYAILPDLNAQLQGFCYRYSRVDPVPAQIGLIVGDAIHNIRSSLDFLIYCFAVEANLTGQARDNAIKRAQFPFSKSESDYGSAFDGVAKFPAPTLKAFLKSFRPYDGGDGELVAIHKLDIIDKHRTLLFGALGAARLTVTVAGTFGTRHTIDAPPGVLVPLKENEPVLPPVAREAEMSTDPEFMVQVALAEPGLESKPEVLHALRSCRALADRIITGAEPILADFMNGVL